MNEEIVSLIEQFQSLKMDEVRQFSGKQIEELVEQFQWKDEAIAEIGGELFSDGITLSRIAHFYVFAEKLIQRHPEKKNEICEAVFRSITENLSF